MVATNITMTQNNINAVPTIIAICLDFLKKKTLLSFSVKRLLLSEWQG